ncbi:MAG TPA: DMT family transporter [Pseudolabrys sp.]|nr:DMT family transporter [Pseudolabrys sp.]
MTTATPPAPGARRFFGLADNPYLLLALTSLFWSGNHVVGRAIGGHVPPFAISTLRWLIPSLLLWFFARRTIVNDWPAMRASWKILLWLGITGGTMFTSLQYVGLQYTSALNVSVLNSLTPVLIVATGALLFRDPVTPLQSLGIVTSLLGVLAIIARGDIATLLHMTFNGGDILIVFNMMLFSVYTAYYRLRPQISPISILFAFGAVSALGSLPFAIGESLSGYTLQADWPTVAAVLYVAFFPGLLAYAFWNRGVELLGANRAGPFQHLIPLYSAILASTFLGERLHAFHILGFALIIGGVWMASSKGKPAAEKV